MRNRREDRLSMFIVTIKIQKRVAVHHCRVFCSSIFASVYSSRIVVEITFVQRTMCNDVSEACNAIRSSVVLGQGK